MAKAPDDPRVEAARSVADALGRELAVVEFTHADLERAVPELVAATGRSNPMDIGVALPLYLVAERVAADGHDRLTVGQGADERDLDARRLQDVAGGPRGGELADGGTLLVVGEDVEDRHLDAGVLEDISRLAGGAELADARSLDVVGEHVEDGRLDDLPVEGRDVSRLDAGALLVVVDRE